MLGIDARTGRIARRFPIGGSSIGIAYGAGSLWLVGGGDVVRVDPRSGTDAPRLLRRRRTGSCSRTAPSGRRAHDGSVWKIDPVENRITAHAKLHPWLSDLAVGGGFVWASIVGEDEVFKLSEDDLSVQRASPAGPDPERISTGGGDVWVANTAAKAVSISAETRARDAASRRAPSRRPCSSTTASSGRPRRRGLPSLPPVAARSSASRRRASC